MLNFTQNYIDSPHHRKRYNIRISGSFNCLFFLNSYDFEEFPNL